MLPPFQNLSDPIFYFARERPSAPAIKQSDLAVTYAELASFVGRAAVHLRDLGIKFGELVGLSLPTDLPHIVLHFALLRIGAIPVDVPLRRPNQQDFFKLFGVRRVITLPGVDVPGVAVHALDGAWKAQIERKSGDFRHPDPSDNNLIFSITSGSTGAPKGVVTTQREWWERYRSAVAIFPELLDPSDPPHLLVLGEISFSGFFFVVANQLCIGGPLVLIGVVESTDYAIEAIRKWDDSVFLITPPMGRDMLSRGTPGEALFPRARAVLVGASPLYPEEKSRFKSGLSPNLYEVYGNAATGFISVLRPSEIESYTATVGRVAPGIAVEIVDGSGRIAPPNGIGFVRCRGSGISQRFLNAEPSPPSAPEGIRNGSFYTGDIGLMDSRGYIHLKGRVTEVIKRGEIIVFPQEIEAVLGNHPSVAEAAVIGMPTATGDQQIFGIVAPRETVDLNVLAEHCKKFLSAEKMPNRLLTISSIPKTGPGKVDKPSLVQAVMNRLKSETSQTAPVPEVVH